MNLSLDRALECIVDKMLDPKEHEQFLNDAEIIANKIYETMLAEKFIFADMFKELKNVAYRQDHKIDLPENFNITLMYELPFSVIPIFDEFDGTLIRLKTTHEMQHPIVEQNYVDALRFDFILTCELQDIIEKCETIIATNECKYLLTYSKYRIFDETFHHSITAMEYQTAAAVAADGTNTGNLNYKTIIFDFKPSLKFYFNQYPLPLGNEQQQFQSDLYWLAYPIPGLYTDFQCMLFEIPFWQIINETERNKLRYALLLMLTYDYKGEQVLFDIFIFMHGFKLKIQADGFYMLRGNLSLVFIEILRLLASMTKRSTNVRYKEFTRKVENTVLGFQSYILLECIKIHEVFAALKLK